LPQGLLSLCEQLSEHCSLAYVEAEFFGGVQSAGPQLQDAIQRYVTPSFGLIIVERQGVWIDSDHVVAFGLDDHCAGGAGYFDGSNSGTPQGC
jgi:hypothetical protein